MVLVVLVVVEVDQTLVEVVGIRTVEVVVLFVVVVLVVVGDGVVRRPLRCCRYQS